MTVLTDAVKKNLIYFGCVVLILLALAGLGKFVMGSSDSGDHNVYIDCPEWEIPA